MELTIKAEATEIAAPVLEPQERQPEISEFFPITIKEIERYTSEGWLIYDISTKEQVEEHGLRYIVLANPNHQE